MSNLAAISKLKGILEAKRVPMYHSVFVQHPKGGWIHHFDADDKEDARLERDSIRNQGEKGVTLRVPKHEAQWHKMGGQGITDYVNGRLAKNISNKKKIHESKGHFVGASAPKFDKKIDKLSTLSDDDLHREIGARVADDVLDHFRNKFATKHGRHPETDTEHNEIYKAARASTASGDVHKNLMGVIRTHTDNALNKMHHANVKQSALPTYGKEKTPDSLLKKLGRIALKSAVKGITK